MNTYENISNELKAFFSNHSLFKVLLPLDMVLVFGGAGIIILQKFISFGDLGGLLGGIAYWGLILGLLLAYANMHEKYMYIGFFAYSACEAWSIITNLKYFIYNLGTLLTCLIFGGLGYLVFKRASLSRKV